MYAEWQVFSGFRVAEASHADEAHARTKDIPVIAVTARVDGGHVERANEAVAMRYW